MSTQYKTNTTRHIATLAGTALLPLVVAIGLAPSPAEANFLIDTAEAQQGQGQGQGGGRDLLNIGRGKGNGFGAGSEGRTLESDIFRDAASGQGQGQGGGKPDGAGGGGKPDGAGGGGKPDGVGGGGGDTAKGGDYGDIVVILRNDDGTPALDENGNIQPCLDPACETYTQLVEGEEGDLELPEGVIPVEFGRLNVARSPESVVDHSLAELLSKLDGQTITSETLADMTDEAGRLIVENEDGTTSTIDSPLENFALYVALIEAAGSDPTADSYTLSISTDPHGDEAPESYSMTVGADVVMTLAASAFSAASDKTGDLTVDEIMGITGFVDLADELSTLVESDNYTYDREALYADVMVTVLKEVDVNGTIYYQPTDVYLLDEVVFNTVPTIDDDANGIDVFTQQADDAVQVLEYVHDFALEAE